jgi:hypothetical protein
LAQQVFPNAIELQDEQATPIGLDQAIARPPVGHSYGPIEEVCLEVVLVPRVQSPVHDGR